MSAPSVSGRWMAGEANVLSTTISGRRPPSAARRGDGRGDLGDVDDLEQRVRRRLEPDEPRPLGQRLPEHVRSRRPGRRSAASTPAAGPADALEIAVRAAVDVVADDDLVARPGELGDGRGRRRARGEGDPVPRRPRAPRPPARGARASGSASGRTRSRGAACRRRPGRRSRSGRSAARPRRSARRARRRRGRRACRRRARHGSSRDMARSIAPPWQPAGRPG